MDVQAMQALLADLSKAVGVVSRPRRPHGFWTPYAWAVRALVTSSNMSVSDAAKIVLRNAGLAVTTADVACVRVVYYKIRDHQWPEGMYEALMGRLEEVDVRSGAAILSDIGADVPETDSPVPETDDSPIPETDDSPIPDSDDSPIPDDLRAELEAELQSGFIDPDADPDYVPDFEP